MPHSVHTRTIIALSRSLEAKVGEFCGAFQGHLEALQNDRNCMLVHFANGRILLSNACCDRLFSPLTPLRHREVTEIVAEEDRVNFSSRIMYLSIGKYSVMQREQFKIITAKGVVPANIFGEHLMGSVWWMDCELVEDEDYQSFECPYLRKVFNICMRTALLLAGGDPGRGAALVSRTGKASKGEHGTAAMSV
eukprot:s4242_g6.t1